MSNTVVVTSDISVINKMPIITTPDGKGVISFHNNCIVYTSNLSYWFTSVFLATIYNNITASTLQANFKTLTPFRNTNGVYRTYDLLNAIKSSWKKTDDTVTYQIGVADSGTERTTYDHEMILAFYCFKYLLDSNGKAIFDIRYNSGILELIVVGNIFNAAPVFTFPS